MLGMHYYYQVYIRFRAEGWRKSGLVDNRRMGSDCSVVNCTVHKQIAPAQVVSRGLEAPFSHESSSVLTNILERMCSRY